MGRVFYLIPDIFRPDFSAKNVFAAAKGARSWSGFRKRVLPKYRPVGGIKVMYQHCQLLKEIGYDVYPLLLGDYKGDYYGFNLDCVRYEGMKDEITERDIVVATEFSPYDAMHFPRAKKVMFVQNWINIGQRFRPEDEGKNYTQLGYDHVISCGDYLTGALSKLMDQSATTITNFVDHSKFIPNARARVSGRVLVLSRKNFKDFKQIRQVCGKSVDFRVVDGLTQDKLIEEYQQADVFLATGYPEGFSLPPLEAMCCGCVVVGFTGRGASEFMVDHETALVAEDGDNMAAAKKLLQILEDESLKERLRESGYTKAKGFTRENTAGKLKDFFENTFSHLSRA